MAVLNDIMTWVAVATTGLQWILWVNGAAGAGKSAIARSIVDLCLKQKIVVTRFFFFRTDPSRNNIKPLVATLAYQLITLIPALGEIISQNIRSDPLIFDQSLEHQFEALIFEPLRKLHQESPFKHAIILLVDGIDECTIHKDQVNLIHTISQFIAEKIVPLIVIFSSRAETQIQMAFNYDIVDSTLRRVSLDNNYAADDDIRLFLRDSFKKIKTTHPFKPLIDYDWPAPSHVEEIVEKSSGQFIYASVVMKFLLSPRLHPVQQLEIIRGLRPVGALTPFAQLDALYQHIFSHVQDIVRTTSILAVAILSSFTDLNHIEEMLHISCDDIHVALADLTSVVKCSWSRIVFLHASLPDFLLDRLRAQSYHIERAIWSARLSVMFLSAPYPASFSLFEYFPHAKCTPQLREALYAFYPGPHLEWHTAHTAQRKSIWIGFMSIVKGLDFGDGGAVYRHQLERVARHMHNYLRWELHELEEEHDISGILADIAREKAIKGKRSVGTLLKSVLFRAIKK